MSFVKGVLLKDEENILVAQTENVQSAKVIKFTGVKEIIKLDNVLKAYIFEAIDIEKQGLKVEMKKTSDFAVPEELEIIFKKNADFKKAFHALTPGRQRGWLYHFAQPKQSATKVSRIEKAMPSIFNGKGLND